MNKKRLIGIIAACVIVVAVVVVVATRPPTGIFADANLEAAVREAIEVPKGPICPADPEALTILHASGIMGRKIVDLTCLEEEATVHLQNNPPSEDSVNIHIPNLAARGVSIYD